MAVFIIILVVLMLFGIPVAFALGLASVGYMLSVNIDLANVVQSMVRGTNSFTMLAIPFFFMAGELMNTSGITERIIRLANVLVGHFKGGLAQVNIVASIFFAGISGSATADTAALGAALIPAMEKEGYDKDFAAAITVASSVVGPIIPPSITLVLYGIMAQQDIGRLLIAGLLPGLLVSLTQMIYTHWYSKKMDYPSRPKANFNEAVSSLYHGVTALIMPIIIIGGVMGGFFTPTESAAVAVLYGLIIGFFVYKNLNGKKFWESLKRVGLSSMNNMFILACATVFSWVITMARVPDAVVKLMFSISQNSFVLTLLLLLFLFVVGMFMMASQALVVLTPILLPVAIKIGIDPIHFGIIMVTVLTFGGCTPPVGSMLFVVSDISNLSLERLSKAMLPLYIPLIVAILLITFIPEISLLLPNLMIK